MGISLHQHPAMTEIYYTCNNLRLDIFRQVQQPQGLSDYLPFYAHLGHKIKPIEV